MNAFETLAIAPRLVLDAEILNSAFREAGRTAHPDAGGGDEAFARLRESYEILSSPSKRLKHWLELCGTPAETRGTVDPRLMDLFSQVGGATQQAEALIRKREEAKSALVLAMLESETHVCREAVAKALALIEDAICGECATFPGMQESTRVDVDSASMTYRNLLFLEKWRTGLRGVFSRLV